MAVIFMVWNESGEISGPHRKREIAERRAEMAARDCEQNGCETDGQENTPGRGDFKCGVMSPHGIHIQVIENGEDVTAHDYGQY